MKLERLLKQKAQLEEQIKHAEIAAKNRNRVERLVIRLLNKHPDLFLCDPVALEKNLDESFADVAGNLKNRHV